MELLSSATIIVVCWLLFMLFVCLAKTVCRPFFSSCVYVCVCVCSSQVELIFCFGLAKRTQQQMLHVPFCLLPSFNVHTFLQPILSFVDGLPPLIRPQVLPIAAGLFDANKSIRRYFLMKVRWLQRGTTKATTAAIAHAGSCSSNSHTISATLTAFLCMWSFK